MNFFPALRVVVFVTIVIAAGLLYWWLRQPAEPDFLGMFALGAAALSFVYLAVRELCAQPDLLIEAHTHTPLPTIESGRYGVHHLKVTNKPVNPFVNIFASRASPEGVQLFVRYTRIDEGRDEPALCGQWLLGRWGTNPQPIDPVAISANQFLSKFFPAQAEAPRSLHYTAAFALKQDDDRAFYHFNDESYEWGAGQKCAGGSRLRFCNPAWRLEGKEYKVEVKIVGQGLSAKDATFRLRNPDTHLTSFTLEQWQRP